MPSRALKACAYPGCPELTRQHMCVGHAGKAATAYERSRGSAAARGYDAAWRKRRASFLTRNPFCACGQPATDVDHIQPRRGPEDDVETNLQALCHACHSRKTALENGRWGGKQKGDANHARA